MPSRAMKAFASLLPIMLRAGMRWGFAWWTGKWSSDSAGHIDGCGPLPGRSVFAVSKRAQGWSTQQPQAEAQVRESPAGGAGGLDGPLLYDAAYDWQSGWRPCAGTVDDGAHHSIPGQMTASPRCCP